MHSDAYLLKCRVLIWGFCLFAWENEWTFGLSRILERMERLSTSDVLAFCGKFNYFMRRL